MRILVTGGAGFIGSHFVQAAAARGRRRRRPRQAHLLRQPREPARRTSSSTRATSPIPDDVASAARGCDAIVNFAAETHVDRSILAAEDFGHTDVPRHAGPARACARARASRFVQVSTDEVYGDLEAGGSSKETDPLSPSSPYSAAKAAGDLLIPAYVRTFGVNASITRGSNTYGPNQYPEKFIPLFVTNALDGEPLPLYGDGRQMRDWLYVEDHCAGIELVLREGAPGEIYNVGGGDERRTSTSRERILELTGADRVAAPPRRRPPRPRPPLLARHDEAARARLGAADGVRRRPAPRRVDWYRDNRDWWEPIKSGEYREYYERQYADRLANARQPEQCRACLIASLTSCRSGWIAVEASRYGIASLQRPERDQRVRRGCSSRSRVEVAPCPWSSCTACWRSGSAPRSRRFISAHAWSFSAYGSRRRRSGRAAQSSSAAARARS